MLECRKLVHQLVQLLLRKETIELTTSKLQLVPFLHLNRSMNNPMSKPRMQSIKEVILLSRVSTEPQMLPILLLLNQMVIVKLNKTMIETSYCPEAYSKLTIILLSNNFII